MSKNTIIATLASFLAMFVILLVIGLVNGDEPDTAEPETTEPNQETVEFEGEYSQEQARQDFVDSCSTAGATREMCACMYGEFAEDYTIREMADFGIRGELPADYYKEYVKPCQNQINSTRI